MVFKYVEGNLQCVIVQRDIQGCVCTKVFDQTHKKRQLMNTLIRNTTAVIILTTTDTDRRLMAVKDSSSMRALSFNHVCVWGLQLPTCFRVIRSLICELQRHSAVVKKPTIQVSRTGDYRPSAASAQATPYSNMLIRQKRQAMMNVCEFKHPSGLQHPHDLPLNLCCLFLHLHVDLN